MPSVSLYLVEAKNEKLEFIRFYFLFRSGFIGSPPRIACKAPCEDVKCGQHAYCKADGNEAYCVCDDGWTYNPSDISAGCVDINECDAVHGPSGRCGLNAICSNTPGGFTCQCPPGFSGNAQIQCIDIDECSKPNRCGPGAQCINRAGSFECICPEGSIPDPDPSVRCITVVSCTNNNDCPGNAICDEHNRCLCPTPNIGNDCRHPCESIFCGPNSNCMIVNQDAKCLCAPGFVGSADRIGGCVDDDECKRTPSVCPEGSICINNLGSYTCQCPGGVSGDPFNGGCTRSDIVLTCDEQNPCAPEENCIVDNYLGKNVCVCRQGFIRDQVTNKCVDIDECANIDKPACGMNSLCKNLPGSYECFCPPNFFGNPYSICEECTSAECQCKAPYKFVGGNCILAGCQDGGKCPKGAECISIAGGVSYCACPKGYRTQSDGSCIDVNECLENQHFCAFGAECINRPGSYECICPPGYDGDAYHGQCSAPQRRCAADKECGTNEKCVQPGECICPPPFFLDTSDGNKCKNPCERYICGINAKCTPSDPPQCMCEVGFKGDPLQGCFDENECSTYGNPCAYGAQCVNQKGGYKCVCPNGMGGDPYKGGCILTEDVREATVGCKSNNDCADTLACVQGKCISPCKSLRCGQNAYCEPEGHAAWCRCRVGFVENENGDCVSREYSNGV